MNGRENLSTLQLILQTFSSPIRVKILLTIHDHHSISFSALMKSILNEIDNTSKLSYHLKQLVNAGLVQHDKKTKTYTLTKNGQFVVNFILALEDKITIPESILVFDVLNNKIIGIEEYINEIERIYRLSMSYEQRLRILESVRKLKEKIIPSTIIDNLIFFSFLKTYINTSMENVFTPPFSLRIVNYIEQKKSPIYRYAEIQKVPATISKVTMFEQLFLMIRDELKSNIFKIDDFCSFIYPCYHHLNVQTTIKKVENLLKLTKGLETLMTHILFMSTSYPYSQIALSIDNFNFHVAKYVGEYNDYQLKDALFKFFSTFYIHSHLFPKISFEISFLSEKNIHRLLPEELRMIHDEYYEELYKFAVFFLESYLSHQKVHPSINPHISIKFDKDQIKDKESILYGILNRILWNLSHNFPLNLSFSNVEARWHENDFTYGYDGELTSVETPYIFTVNNVMGRIGINLVRISFLSKGDDELFLNTIQKSISKLVNFIKALDEKYTQKFLFRREFFPLYDDLFLRRHYHLYLIGLNEAVREITGFYPWEDQSSTNYTYKLLKLISELILDFSEDIVPIKLSNIYSLNDGSSLAHKDYTDGLNIDTKANKIKYPLYTSTTSPFHGNISLNKAIKIESLLHPFFNGGHRLSIRLSEQVRSEQLFNVVKNILNTAIGSFTFSYEATYCDKCFNWIKGTHISCPKCGNSEYIFCTINVNGLIEKIKMDQKRKFKISTGYNKRLL